MNETNDKTKRIKKEPHTVFAVTSCSKSASAWTAAVVDMSTPLGM